MRYLIGALIGAIGGAIVFGFVVLSYWFIPIALVLLGLSVLTDVDITTNIVLLAFGIPFALGAFWGLVMGTIAGLAASDG